MIKLKQITRTILIVVVLGSNISCDQISKTIVRKNIDTNARITLLGNYFTLTKIENQGAFLSVGNSLPPLVRFIFLTLLPLVVLGFAFGYVVIKTTLPNLTVIGICFVVGGGIGNVYDRVIYGSVTDFIHIDLILFQTGIFNMADVSIMIGIGIILWGSFRQREKLITP